MSNELKITFVGGSDHLGDSQTVELDAPVLVGRSHTAAIRFTDNDRDVSGKHLEIRKESDGVFAVAIKEYVFNERDRVGCGDLRKLARGDVLTLGPKSRAGIRIDALPTGGEAGVSAETPTGETRFTSATRATQMSLTAATRVTGLTAATGVTGLTAATGMTGRTGASGQADVADPATDRPTGDPNPVDGKTEIINPEDIFDDSASAHSCASSDMTSVLGAITQESGTSEGVTSGGGATGPGIGGTVLLPGGDTVVIAPDVLPKIDPDAPRRFRKRLMVFSIFGFAAMLGVVIYSRMNHSDRFLSHPNFVVSTFKDADGSKELEVDYPWGPGSRKDETPTSLKVMTLTGKDRKCPYNLDFSISRDPAQIGLSLEDAAAREVAALTSKGYAFSESADDRSVALEERNGFFFYEDQYPRLCQGVPRGTRFFRREYTVARDGRNWWGVFMLLRDGDRVFRLFREIPESQKPRGKYLLVYNPNLKLYGSFLWRRWESSGKDEALAAARLEDLMRSTSRLVKDGWPTDWEKIARNINAMMIMTYGKNTADRKSVSKLLEDFRESKDRLWMDFERKRDIAIKNGDSGALKEVRSKCRAAFGKDTTDWRSKRCNDAKEWPCEIKRSGRRYAK